MYLAENIEEIKIYRPAKLCTGKEWFVEYYIYNPELKKMSRKKVKINYIEKIAERRTFGYGLVRRLNAELEKGWNPFIAEENSKSYALLTKVLDDFMNLNRKKFKEGDIREATILSYESYFNKLSEYIVKKKYTEVYVYSFNKEFVIKYLDYIYDELNLSSRTRDNYLKYLRLFSNYLVERTFVKVSPADSVSVLGKGKRAPKNRTIVPPDIMVKVSEYLELNNRNFLLASQILYFCMVRPKEMTHIRISHIDLEKSVIFIPGETAKNYKDAVVTIPTTLNTLIREMGVLNNPPEYYLFSTEFKPGKAHIKETLFSKFWDRHVRKDLGLPLSLKFYSLKDTGITDMIRTYNDPLLARDQARHHDLSVTNMYTPSDTMRGNDRIKNDTSKF
ncbi:MAG: tyrosine-type recombinase/integrase [Bacteroidota bacterium]